MNLIKIILVCIIAVFFNSCTESTTNPQISTQNRIDILTKHIWVFKFSDNGKTPEGVRFNFHKDGTLMFYKDNQWLSGNWTIDSEYVTLTTSFQTKIEVSTLHSISDTKMILKTNIDSIQTLLTYIPEVNNSSPIKIEGSITFFPDVPNQDLSQAKLAVLWPSPENEFQAIIWGIGTVSVNNATFSINIDNNVPMSLFMQNTYRIDGYMNLGFIVLLWDNSVQNGKIYDLNNPNDDLYKIQMGAVEDRAIIYINGNYKTWDIDFLINDFNQGYNFCKGWYKTQQGQNDGWQVTPVLNNQILKVLKAGNGIKGFKFPNWG